MKPPTSFRGLFVATQGQSSTRALEVFRVAIRLVSLHCEGLMSISPLTELIVSFAGLIYLTLFVCAKLAITIPFLSFHNPSPKSLSRSADEPSPPRSQAAAPPVYLLVCALIPVCAAIYISSTRYSDFYHHGFDIIAGAILGIASAWLGFRWFHMPVRRGGGWAWAPRSPNQAFSGGIGPLTYTSEEMQEARAVDIESGTRHAGGFGDATAPDHSTSSQAGQGIALEDTGRARR